MGIKESKHFKASVSQFKSSTLQTERLSLDEKAYEFIRDFVFKKAGITLNTSKRSMIQSRLSRRVNFLNLNSINEYLSYLKTNSSELTSFINALTTNKTDFFRESEHFDYLADNYLKEYVQKHAEKNKVLLTWSAACSTGPEVYTLAMIFDKFFKRYDNFDFKILGSDIDTDVVKTAESGVYADDIIERQIPPEYLRGNFSKGIGNNSGFYKISDNLKKKVKFKQHNLIEDNSKMLINFDIVFLRNVLIYFQASVIQQVIDLIVKSMAPGGLLFIGHAETLNGIKHDLISLGSSIYRKK